MDRRRFLALAGGASAGLAGCVGIGGSEGRGDYDIGMSATAFLPTTFETAVGETVVWRNTSSRAHTVTAYEGRVPDGAVYFASGGFDDETAARDAYFADFGGAINPGETYEHTFGVAGRYDYFCVPHERAGMIGTVTVRE